MFFLDPNLVLSVYMCVYYFYYERLRESSCVQLLAPFVAHSPPHSEQWEGTAVWQRSPL